jgi:hypothetical protein
MAFLDNSGDIILDAVLTDTGRMRLSRGDGSFKITKFALSDDEINYESYNKDHVSGSAYYDLEVLQTPVLEAFTNNASSMKSKLISIARNNLLYLPVIKINQIAGGAGGTEGGQTSMNSASGSFFVACDQTTENTFDTSADGVGLLFGARPGSSSSYRIRLDQGLDTTAINPARAIDSDLVETQYILEMDNRLGSIVSIASAGAKQASVSFIDDDNIASYYLSLGTDLDYISENTERSATGAGQTISGPRGTILEFQVQASLELASSTYLFTQLGSTFNVMKNDQTGAVVYYIDSFVRVRGATTGYTVDVPIRFIKYKEDL